MIECAVLGDSIAVGIGLARPQCQTMAQIGITSATWVKRYAWHMPEARTMIISLGSNDRNIDTEAHIRHLRINAAADRVYWILPSRSRSPEAANAVARVAAEFGDRVLVPPAQHVGRDGVHLTRRGYQIIASQAR